MMNELFMLYNETLKTIIKIAFGEQSILWKGYSEMRGSVPLILASILVISCGSYSNSSTEYCENDTCESMDGPCFVPRQKGILTRLEGVRVGYSAF